MPATPVAIEIPAWTWLAGHPWLYPVLEALHICGIALLLGSLVLFELRVWGLGTTLPPQALGRLALGVSLAGFSLAAATGLLMFSTQPAELLVNRAFRLKFALLTLAGLNAAAFHARGGLAKLDAMARLQTVVSLGLWLAVIICGRWIAYA
ncbi:hypothetical protein [Caldimonas brevitalea]|uniref:Membrane protein n=1 Tax=Caldimonas brevitalea TaxID=413882 RepID=A0A0G3BIT8_9BURK|nr:hypothetical protein [Caldimonas brevitalea]AKJ29354.1 membrane protein [Caldimonas brevitalea]